MSIQTIDQSEAVAICQGKDQFEHEFEQLVHMLKTKMFEEDIRMKPIDQIEAFVNEVSPIDASSAPGLTDFEKPRKISTGSTTFFKTTKRRQYDSLLREFESLLDVIFDNLRVMKDVRDKLQIGVVFSRHEVMAQREQLKAARSHLSTFLDNDRIRALDEAIKATTGSDAEARSTDEMPYQKMLSFRRGRFGLWKRYKKAKHSQVISMCAYAVRDIVKHLKRSIEENDNDILAINRNRHAVRQLRSAVLSAPAENEVENKA